MINQTLENRLEIKEVNLRNLKQYQDFMLTSENVFHPELREDLAGINEVLSSVGAIGRIACLNGGYIGNALGFCPTQAQIEEMELLGLKQDSNTLYISNFVIDPSHQRKGYGTQLLSEFIRQARINGFKAVEGHFRDGSSFYIVKKLGAKQISVFPNWFGTNESYTHCRLEL